MVGRLIFCLGRWIPYRQLRFEIAISRCTLEHLWHPNKFRWRKDRWPTSHAKNITNNSYMTGQSYKSASNNFHDTALVRRSLDDALKWKTEKELRRFGTRDKWERWEKVRRWEGEKGRKSTWEKGTRGQRRKRGRQRWRKSGKAAKMGSARQGRPISMISHLQC